MTAANYQEVCDWSSIEEIEEWRRAAMDADADGDDAKAADAKDDAEDDAKDDADADADAEETAGDDADKEAAAAEA